MPRRNGIDYTGFCSSIEVLEHSPQDYHRGAAAARASSAPVAPHADARALVRVTRVIRRDRERAAQREDIARRTFQSDLISSEEYRPQVGLFAHISYSDDGTLDTMQT